MSRYLREKRMDEENDVFLVKDTYGNILYASNYYKKAFKFMCSYSNTMYLEGLKFVGHNNYVKDILACQ